MFTGIVQATCKVINIETKAGLKTFEVALTPELTEGLVVGASVANNGVCLTVTQMRDNIVLFDVMEETLTVSNLGDLVAGDWVNIERSLKYGTEIGGHILSGHIHTQANVIEISHTDQHYNIHLGVEKKWMDYIFYKGFIGINGCSLTVGEVTKDSFWLHLIPETLHITNLSDLKVNGHVNIEIDSQTQVIVDTVAKIMAKQQAQTLDLSKQAD
ncbi:riboflavin synthase subunit alpha [Shewanella intestini]|uniref:Riboflavin synthase n=1 Tax=Shewanella intestini TaxID=2017544 RepID=A0ABS5I2I5_9GAMM|nr:MULTISPECIES: riboflavin synthase subunit alpha [Shewanella]MBR9727904.1 riboflavin synthase subunit alpha [Shewanella intestini]MRG36103.1 riboflavin synthase subunit alpha [Shewanella sp. XMDDZSB0408]